MILPFSDHKIHGCTSKSAQRILNIDQKVLDDCPVAWADLGIA